jgi:deoxyribodipyrimidine photolyase-related protein
VLRKLPGAGQLKTVWVFGDQLNRQLTALKDETPDTARILLVRNEELVTSRRWHKQRLHLILTSMRRFAQELRDEGFEVDERDAKSFVSGLNAHKREFKPDAVMATQTLSSGYMNSLSKHGVEFLKTNQMLCHYEDFAQWAGTGEKLLMENFYRWQRRRLDVLMDGDKPAGGRWNYDDENRLPPPKKPRDWYEVQITSLNDVDREVLDSLPKNAFGQEPIGLWATSRADALERLDYFINEVLPEFGPYEDAMLTDEFRLAHSMLSHALNIGLLMPDEVVDAAEHAYRQGKVPIASAEGFIRQIIGWREFIWNVYWRWIPEYRNLNELNAKEPLPPMFFGKQTDMHCMDVTIKGVDDNAYSHHIQRLMILGNFSLIAGVEPIQLNDWMRQSYIDGADWVMLANVLGLSQFADGGRMATKPYASGGAYINRMSDYCKGCKYDPKKRVGDDACPFTTLYWDFMDRHKTRFAHNHRMVQPVRGVERLNDMPDVRKRAREVRKLMQEGKL